MNAARTAAAYEAPSDEEFGKLSRLHNSTVIVVEPPNGHIQAVVMFERERAEEYAAKAAFAGSRAVVMACSLTPIDAPPLDVVPDE